jgi:hypothetical protein
MLLAVSGWMGGINPHHLPPGADYPAAAVDELAGGLEGSGVVAPPSGAFTLAQMRSFANDEYMTSI